LSKSKGKQPAPAAPARTAQASSSRMLVPRTGALESVGHVKSTSSEEVDGAQPHFFENLGEKQHGRRLDETSAQAAAAAASSKEPTSALEHYEKAVEREDQGRQGESLSLYRKAFKVYCTSIVYIYQLTHPSSTPKSTTNTKQSTSPQASTNPQQHQHQSSPQPQTPTHQMPPLRFLTLPITHYKASPRLCHPFLTPFPPSPSKARLLLQTSLPHLPAPSLPFRKSSLWRFCCTSPSKTSLLSSASRKSASG
jgi:F-box protein 9